MPSARRLSGVDGLRGLACVAVVVLHVWMYTGQDDPSHPPVLGAVLGELRQGLTYFFVLSAFLLVTPWLRAGLDGAPVPRLARYARHRAARVLPAYWAALLGAFAVLAGTGHPREVDASLLPVYAVLAQNHVGATLGQLNPPTWSLGVEVAFYLALPLAGRAIVRAGRARGRAGVVAVAAALVAAGMGYAVCGELAGWPGTATTSLGVWLPVFAAGIAAAALCHGRRVPGRWCLALVVSGAAAIAANGWWHAQGTGLAGHVVRDLPAAIGFGAIIAAVISRPPGLLDLAPVRWLGTVSFGAYLWHMPAIYWLRENELFPAEPAPAMAVVLASTFGLAAMSWYLVEQPVLRRAARRRPARAAHRRRSPAFRRVEALAHWR